MPANELIMGFDFGTKKIGIAVGQRLTETATPIGIIYNNRGKPNWGKIEQLVNEWQPSRFVVGLPLNMDDSDSKMSLLATKFAQELAGKFSVPAETMDERLSSFEVRQHDKDVDDLAAVVILESWLRQRAV